jgi:hypothetical protein
MGRRSGLKASQCLSSFSEDSDCTISSISLHGVNLAYCLSRPDLITIIVDWHSVNGKQADHDSCFMRWYLQSGVGTVSLMHGFVAKC